MYYSLATYEVFLGLTETVDTNVHVDATAACPYQNYDIFRNHSHIHKQELHTVTLV